MESDFTIIGSSGCTHELFEHSTVRQANTNNCNIMQETCVTVTLMKFFYRLAELTGDSKYVDAFETSLYNAYLGSINTEKVVEGTILKEHADWDIEPLPFDSYSPLTTKLSDMSDNYDYLPVCTEAFRERCYDWFHKGVAQVKRLFYKRNSLMHFLQNYLFFAAAVFVLMVPVFFEAFRILEKNEEERTYREIVRGSSLIDDEISSIGNAIFRLRSNVSYSYVRSMKGTDKTSDYYRILEFRNYFADLTGSYTFFKSPLCYFSNGIVITPKTVYLDADKEGSLLYRSVRYENQKMWLTDLAKTDYSYRFLRADTFYNAAETIEGLPYVHTYVSAGNRENAMFLAILPIDRIYELTGLTDLREIAGVTIQDHTTNEILYASRTQPAEKSSLFEIRSSQSPVSITVEIPKNYFRMQMKGMEADNYDYFTYADEGDDSDCSCLSDFIPDCSTRDFHTARLA